MSDYGKFLDQFNERLRATKASIDSGNPKDALEGLHDLLAEMARFEQELPYVLVAHIAPDDPENGVWQAFGPCTAAEALALEDRLTTTMADHPVSCEFHVIAMVRPT